ncbi:MAG TPA: hypothetical protein P5119_06450 [Candidatus Aminicenantes bacterium]|nr:hypothetical protein [Candidatus Aminicenantes bacterium]HRY64967.1 hypothetical protein [Candidatus Aminicenantes bacterium]HRZ71880.1 hypothetical protein [Candidatus Aminicenantes bacterium]
MKRVIPVLRPAGLLLAALVLAGPPAPAQIGAPVSEFPMRTFFTVRSAEPDASIPDAVREQFEKDDGSPLRSVVIDLNGDGRPEKVVLCGVPAQSGGYQWLVFDPAGGEGLGLVVGAIIFVGRETDGGYARLETYWRQGGDMSIVSRYAFSKGRYGRTGTRALSLWEASEYFRAKGALDLDRELVETGIKERQAPRPVPSPIP